MITNFKIFESFESLDLPNKGEYLIFKTDTFSGIFFVEIISEFKKSKLGSDTLRVSVLAKVQFVDQRIFSDIYYNMKDKSYYYGNGSKCKILWRGNDKNEALDTFEMFQKSEIYNL